MAAVTWGSIVISHLLLLALNFFFSSWLVLMGFINFLNIFKDSKMLFSLLFICFCVIFHDCIKIESTNKNIQYLIWLMYLVAKLYPILLWFHRRWLTRLLYPWIFQARILEWVVISSFRGSSPPRDLIRISYICRWILNRWATRETPIWLIGSGS